jgi:GNAT superfamily N-acetyltransferase
MRLREFLAEGKQATAAQVLDYVNRTHHEPMTAKLTAVIQAHPQWQLKQVPLQSLNIPNEEYDDEEQEPESDPYGRVMAVDPSHAGEVSQDLVDRRPIVIDSQGWIIDGNHRAWAAAELLNKSDIMAWVPVAQLTELGNAPAEYQHNRKRKRSLFHATVNGQWVDVFFDRSELNNTLHITFTVNGDYDAPEQPTSASKSTVRILSTVLNIIKKQLPEYMAKARPPAVSFTSKQDNRTSLYRKYFVPVIQNILGPKWHNEEYPNMGMTVFHWKPVNQIKEIARIPQGDFGDADTLKLPKYDVEKKELPGGSGFTYAVGKPGPEDLEIMIFDGDTLAAELDLFQTRDVTGAWRVNTVAVNPKYRSRGLGKALYGIALSILKLTVEAGDTQTKHGQRMWLMLNSIPGVEVRGYNMERTEKYKPRPGDEIVAQDKDWTRYTFPVKPGVNSMRSARSGTGMYTSQASMIAKWTGQ